MCIARPKPPVSLGVVRETGVTREYISKIMKTIILSLSAFLLLSACFGAASALPQFRINPADVSAISMKLIQGGPLFPTNEEYVVHMALSKPRADEFRSFTKAHMNEKVQILLGTNVVSEPVLESQVTDGKVVLHCPSDQIAKIKGAFPKR